MNFSKFSSVIGGAMRPEKDLVSSAFNSRAIKFGELPDPDLRSYVALSAKLPFLLYKGTANTFFTCLIHDKNKYY